MKSRGRLGRYAGGVPNLDYRLNEAPDPVALHALWRAAWGSEVGDLSPVLARSLCFVTAYSEAHLIGFVNVAWDGGVHAFVLDTTVHPQVQRQGVGTELVQRAAEAARAAGIHWLHVDFEPHLTGFYRDCGFRPTGAGLLRLTD